MQFYKEYDTNVAYYGFPYLFHDNIFDAVQRCGLVIDSQNTTLISRDKDNKNLIMIIKADIDPCLFLKSLMYLTHPDFTPILKPFKFDGNFGRESRVPTLDKDSSNIWMDLLEIIKQDHMLSQRMHYSFAIPPVPEHDIISILLLGSPPQSSQPNKILTVQTTDGNNIPYCSIPVIHLLTLADFVSKMEGLGITLRESDVSREYDNRYTVTLNLNDNSFEMVKNLIASLTIPFFHSQFHDLVVEDFELIYNKAFHKSIAMDQDAAGVILNYARMAR
jgi:hypothetical protein